MTYLPEVRDALRFTAARHAGDPLARPRPWWRTAVSRAAPVAAVLTSIAVAVVILASVHTAGRRPLGPGGPAGGTPVVPAAWLRDDQRAISPVVFGHNRSCGPRTSIPGRQRMLQRAPGPQLTSLLGVLRQPAPAGQRVSAARVRELQVLAQDKDIYIRYARHGVVDGVNYYLIPAASDIGGPPLPARCLAMELAAFRAQVATLPQTQRTRPIAWEQERIQERRQPRAGVALITTSAGGRGGRYSSIEGLRNHPFMGGGDGNDHITVTALVVPDYVAKVTARFGAQTYPGRVPRPSTVTRPVIHNLVIFVFRGAWDPPSLTYRSASGAVLWSTPRR